jgi:hypothetical protein
MTLDPKIAAAFIKGPPRDPLTPDTVSTGATFSSTPTTVNRHIGFDADGVGPAVVKTTTQQQ